MLHAKPNKSGYFLAETEPSGGDEKKSAHTQFKKPQQINKTKKSHKQKNKSKVLIS